MVVLGVYGVYFHRVATARCRTGCMERPSELRNIQLLLVQPNENDLKDL